MRIAEREIGPGFSPYVVAELSSNHGGSLTKALTLIKKAAHVAWADAAKIQVFDPVKLAEARGGADKVVESGPWEGMTLGELYHRAQTPITWLDDLFGYAREIGITLFASVFDEDTVDLLEQYDCPAYKIASFEIGNTALIRKVAATGKPLILSTGMAEPHEISAAIQAAQGTQFALLHCISAYPCPIDKANLWRIPHMRRVYGCPIGWSDHTLGSEAAIAATALGASIIEKHLTLDRNDGVLDSAFSMEPADFDDMVQSIGCVWDACQESEALTPYKDLKVAAA